MTPLPPGATLETTLVGGRAAAYLRRRAPAASRRPAVVLLHGAMGNLRSFDELVVALEGDEVIVPALPGRSGSEGPAPATVPLAAAFVRGLLEALDLGPCVLVGHSYGGAIALEVALADAVAPRALLSGLLLVATGARLRVHPALLGAARAAAEGEGPRVDLRAAFQPETPAELVAAYEARTADVPVASVLADWCSVAAFDRLGAIGAVRAPTIALAGDRDLLTPSKYAHALAAGIPGARAVVVPGAGHLLPAEHPGAVVEALRELRAAGSAPPGPPLRRSRSSTPAR